MRREIVKFRGVIVFYNHHCFSYYILIISIASYYSYYIDKVKS